MIPRAMGSSFIESIVPTFFEEARSAGWPGNQGSGVLCRFNHSDMHLLGTTQAGTCELNIDRTGLEYRIPDMPRCRDDVLETITRGDCNRSSFTFMDAEDDWTYSGGVTHRTLISGGVLDVAPVSAVAGYQDTTVGMRSLAAFKDVPVDDVFALAQRDELRQLFIRTDQALPPPAAEQRSGTAAAQVHIENLTVHTEDAAAPAPPADPAPPAALPEPPAAPEPPALADEPPATLSWQEAHLRLYETRPYDPISS